MRPKCLVFLFVLCLACARQAPPEAQVEKAQAAKEPIQKAKPAEQIPGDTTTPKEFRDIVSSAGDAEQQANDELRALNRGMRAQYARALEAASAKIDPVIVVQFDGVGGTFHLRDGKRSVKVQPVPQTYELAKCVAHTPLNIYVLLAPHFKNPDNPLWQMPLGESSRQIKSAIQRLDSSALPAEARANARTVLTESAKYIDGIIAKRTFTMEEYGDYAKRIFPAVTALRYFAVEVEVRSTLALLEKWRDELGKERWKQMSAVVITPFTLSEDTPAVQCLRFTMDPERVKDRLINVGGDFGKDVDVAISVLGRLYLDGYAARLTFPQDSEEGREMTQSLSSKRDLMAVPTTKLLKKIAEERAPK